ncbi:MAG TPA: PASTA domain-containing protein [Longimicrobium sp.]|nr:PASTA domain-containing protein [Longimicrobium sp.]
MKQRPRVLARQGPPWHHAARARVRRYFDERALLKWVLITAFSAFVFGYIVVWVLFFPGFGRSPIVTVPDLRGRPQGQAVRMIDRLGLEIQRGGSLPNPRIRRGAVLMQTPLPGEEVTRGTTVRIVLSSGPEMRAVPSIRGLPRDEAVALLQRFGFRVRVVGVRDRTPEGRILGLNPAEGKPAAVGGVIEMRVSLGPPRVLVPGVVGLATGDAAARLEAASLALGARSYDPASPEPAGTILSQSPVAGDSLRMGGRVSVTVAGADPNPPAPEPVDSLPPDTVAPPPAEEPAEEPAEPPAERRP